MMFRGTRFALVAWACTHVRVFFRWLRRHPWMSTAVSIPFLLMGAFHLAVLLLPYPQGIDRPPTAGSFLLDRNGVPLAAFVAADDQQWHVPLTRGQISERRRASTDR